MKTKYVIKGLVNNQIVYFIRLKDELLWNSHFDVRTCSTTIDEATRYNSYNDALYVIKECKLHNFDVYPVCPICGEDYNEHPAISRKNNKTEICPNCGIGEAFIDFCNNYKKNKATN